MANILCVEKSKKSKVRRLAFLPRFGLTVDIGGRQFIYRQAPMLETVVNLFHRGFSMKNLMNVAHDQLSEIELPKVKKFSRDSKKISPQKEKQ